MNALKSKWSPLKEILFTYLAISKILYWYETVIGMNQEYAIDMVRGFFMQLLDRDLLLIIGVVVFYFLDKLIQLKKSKYSSVLEYIIFYTVGYVILMGIVAIYLWVMSLFFPMNIDSWGQVIFEIALNSLVTYIVVIVVLNVKHHFESKKKPPDNRLYMLESLLADGILTQEEFDQKKERVTHE